jgi:hypothetical protein
MWKLDSSWAGIPIAVAIACGHQIPGCWAFQHGFTCHSPGSFQALGLVLELHHHSFLFRVFQILGLSSYWFLWLSNMQIAIMGLSGFWLYRSIYKSFFIIIYINILLVFLYITLTNVFPEIQMCYSAWHQWALGWCIENSPLEWISAGGRGNIAFCTSYYNWLKPQTSPFGLMMSNTEVRREWWITFCLCLLQEVHSLRRHEKKCWLA